jgi:hypothetical protein
MAARRSIQQQHERSIVGDFLKWLNLRRRTSFKVVSEPNPPEAIIRSARLTHWVEVGDVFWTGKYAKDLYSYATPGEVHEPVPPGPYGNMDDRFACEFVKVLTKKLRKRTYLPYLRRYGPGDLVLCVQHPWFNGLTVQRMKEHWSIRENRENVGCFRHVYISFVSHKGRQFRKWRV